MMKMKMVTGLMALLVVMIMAVPATSAGKDRDDTAKARTVTGCLQKGDDANEYALLAKNGSTWKISSDQVDLAPHVGHTVTIRGTASEIHAKAHELKEKTKDEMHEHGMAKSAKEHGHLKVVSLKMVSPSCRK